MGGQENKERKQGREKGQGFDAITVYLPPGMKEDMDTYQRAKRYGNRSQMIREGYRILKAIYPIDSDAQSTERSLLKRLSEIESKLDELKLEGRYKETEIDTLERREHILQKAHLQVDSEEIPNYDEVRADIIELLEDTGPLRDFVIMEHLGAKYERGVVWNVLVKLHTKNKINIEKGEWYLNE